MNGLGERVRNLRRLIDEAPAGESSGGARTLLIASLRQDFATMRRQFVRNTIAGSVLVPRAVRWSIYRLSGLQIDTPKIAEDCRMNNSFLEIGAGASLARGCYFEGSGRIVIGPRTRVGPECAFLTSHHGLDGDRVSSPVSKPIAIGAGAWLGSRVTVLPGAVIGDGCVVAAGAVVTGRCDAGGLYAGVPARLVRRARCLSEAGTGNGKPPDDAETPDPGRLNRK